MPTYVVTTSENTLSPSAKQALAQVITSAHCDDGKIPYFLCQVIFVEFKPGHQFINAKSVHNDQIWVRGDVRSGRDDAQKARIIERVIREGSKATGCDESRFWVYICDIGKMAEFGRIMPGPGKEEEWLADLPADVRSQFTS